MEQAGAREREEGRVGDARAGLPSGPKPGKRERWEGRGGGPQASQAGKGKEWSGPEERGSMGLRAKMRMGGVFSSIPFFKSFSISNSKQFQIRTKSSINTIQNTLFSSNIDEQILGKFSENNF